MVLKANDFTRINFGILTASANGHEFIFQSPVRLDKKRAAQDGCVLFIDGDQQPVEDFNQALDICNMFFGMD